MKRSFSLLACPRARFTFALCLLLCTPAFAQEPAAPEQAPPTGPAQIFNRAQDSRDKAARDRAALDKAVESGTTAAHRAPEEAKKQEEQKPAQVPAPAPDGPTAQAPAATPIPADHADMAGHPALQDPTQPSAVPAPDLPTGSIGVDVISPSGRPMPGADIMLGVMAGSGGRSEKTGKADAEGRYEFKELATGSTQAYRINVMYNGAKFSSTPFRLPDRGGYRVRIPLATTSPNGRMVFQLLGQTIVELRDDRLHVTQQARLTNAGSNVYVFPKEGLLVPLPEGFTAFQWEEQMTDQKAVEEPGKGFRIRGSIPPGSVTLAWVYDLQRDGDTARIPVELPWKTYSYRVISEAPQGLELTATDFPDAEKVKDQGRDLLYTQIRRSPEEPALAAFSIKLKGIPSPGPGRWIAVALASLMVLYGLFRALRPEAVTAGARQLIAQKKQSLVALAKQTEQELQKGEIGPEFHARRMDEITTELAMVLRDEEAAAIR